MPAQEIERKFLVSRLPADLSERPGVEISQGYLSYEPSGGVEVRVRARGRDHLLTVKRGKGAVRDEVELLLTRDQFDALWPLTAGKRIRKTRYVIPLTTATETAFESAGDPTGTSAELDIYEEELEGLVVVEVEFPTVAAAAAFEPPAWFGREITNDERFKNRVLATLGPPPEADV
jgi:CYTH domain-containing protein